MSSQPGLPGRVLFFRPHEDGVQNPKNPALSMDELVVSILQSPPALKSVSPYFEYDVAKVFFNSLFLELLVKIAGVETTLLLIELEHTASSLVDHFFFWKEINILIDAERGCQFYRSFTCLLLFDNAFITVRKTDGTDFLVTRQTFDNPERFGNPLNGAFPRADRDLEDDSGNLVELLPFCSPMTFKDARDKSYTFAKMKVYIDDQKSFLFFVMTLLSFDDEEIEERELDDDSNFEMTKFELSFPIQLCGGSISTPIVFDFSESGDYIASFTIKIGNKDYNVRLYLGAYNDYFIHHRDGHYTLSAISDRNTCTTIFCGYTQAEELMERKMSKVGILAIEIPDFVAPEMDDDSALIDALTPLPEVLQAFLKSITWCNPKETGSN